MANGPEVMLLRLSADVVRKCAGFSFDIGGSAMKIVYRSKEDYDEAMANQNPGAKATVRLIMFPRTDMDKAIDFIINNAYMTRSEGKETIVHTTGVGGYQYRKKLEEQLNVKIFNIGEADCFHYAFKYVFNNLSREELEYPIPEEAMDVPMLELKMMFGPLIEMVKSGKTHMKFDNEDGTTPDFMGDDFSIDTLLEGFRTQWINQGDPNESLAKRGDDFFPIAMGFFGSAFGVMKVDKDWNFTPMDMSPRGGRLCLAMANMLLDCESFDEFIELAGRGNSDNVDYCSRDIKSESMPASDDSDAGGFYDIVSDTQANWMAFCFGKAVNKKKEEFKREDIAAALLRMICNDMAQFIDKTMLQDKFKDIKHVFLAGGFPANNISRAKITRELTARAGGGFIGQMRATPYNVHFLKHGPYLGCIGGLINTVEHFIDPEAKPAAP